MNYEHICFNHYKVFSQAGFNQALYHFIKNFSISGYSKSEIRDCVESYPTSYPCEIYIQDLTFECSKIYIHSPNGNIENK